MRVNYSNSRRDLITADEIKLEQQNILDLQMIGTGLIK